MHRIRTAPIATVVRGQVATASLSDRLADSAQRRLDRLRHDPESGAQTAEYAMLGGVSAAACGGLVYLLKETNILEDLVGEVFRLLTESVGGWFS